jgi:predicted transcriptional regulator
VALNLSKYTILAVTNKGKEKGKGHVHYTDIEKKAVATCLSFATSNTVRKQFYHYLLPNSYVERVSRGIYEITPKGEKLLEILDLG